jgi:VanZ family protein
MPRVWTRRLALWGPLAAWMIAIYGFSSESDPLPSLTNHIWDKALHASGYFLLGLLACRAVAGEGARPLKALIWGALIGTAYGITDEWHQSFVPHRTMDVLDWCADTIGSTLGSAMAAAVVAWWVRKSDA